MFFKIAFFVAYNIIVKMASALPATEEVSTTKSLQIRAPANSAAKFSNVQGTYWNTAKWVGNCLFQNWPQPPGLPYVAIAANLYGSAQYCGTCISVTPVDKKHPSKIAIINDKCADCPNNALDMSPELYNAVMGDAPGRPGLGYFDWEVVSCPYPSSSNMRLISKDGASKDHFSLQIAGTINSVIKVEVKVGNVWQVAVRQNYNYWELSSQVSELPAPDVRVTCSKGAPVTVPQVKIESSNVVTAKGNC